LDLVFYANHFSSQADENKQNFNDLQVKRLLEKYHIAIDTLIVEVKDQFYFFSLNEHGSLIQGYIPTVPGFSYGSKLLTIKSSSSDISLLVPVKLQYFFTELVSNF